MLEMLSASFSRLLHQRQLSLQISPRTVYMSAHSDHSSDSDNNGGEGERWDDWIEELAPSFSLFDDSSFATSDLALQHDKAVHGVDLILLCSTLDFFERIRLINWIRSTKPNPASLKRLDRSAAFLQDDAYLKPIIEDDAILQIDFDSLSLASPSSLPSSSQPASVTALTSPSADNAESALIASLRSQLSDTTQALASLKKIVRDRLGQEMGLAEVANDVVVVRASSSGKGKGKIGADGKERDDDSHYFESYSYNEIHEIMLKDKIRTDSYRSFILDNPALFKDAVVLDVGCGTGILSMFAAQSGARKVYAVDASAVAFKAERNIKDNGFSDVITVIKGKVEDIELPEKVDIIISEWMGYFLLYESMLDSVLSARSRFLSPKGLMVPSQCSILLSLYDASDMMRDRVQFWDDVYGFKMQSMKEGWSDDGVIDSVAGAGVRSNECVLKDVHTQTVTVPELDFETSFELIADSSSIIHAFLGHFDTFFTADGRLIDPLATRSGDAMAKGEVRFGTGAKEGGTHWKQTMFVLKQPLHVVQGTIIAGSFKCSKNEENSRELVVEMTWTVTSPAVVGGSQANVSELHAQVWKVR